MKLRLHIILAVIVALAPLSTATAQITINGNELITNGGAEGGTQFPSTNLYTAPGWTIITGPSGSSGFCACDLHTGGAFPGYTTPGPMPGDVSTRGHKCFHGGAGSALSRGQQIITGASLADQAVIDAGNASYDLKGWFGGYIDQEDNARLTLDFLDASNASLSSKVIGPVSADDRNGQTGMLFKQDQGIVPAGTRTLVVTLQLTRQGGAANNGYADNLSLKLTNNTLPAIVITPPSGGVTATENGTTGSYTVSLASTPTEDVTVTLAPDSQVTVNPPTLTFPKSVVPTPQTVTVTAVDDPDDEGIHFGIVAHSATSSDLNYNNISGPDLTVTITDDDNTPPSPIDPTEGNGSSSGNGEGTYYNSPGPVNNSGEGGCHFGAFLLATKQPPLLCGPYGIDMQGSLVPLPAKQLTQASGSHALVLRSAPPRYSHIPAPADSSEAVVLVLAVLLLGGAAVGGFTIMRS